MPQDARPADPATRFQKAILTRLEARGYFRDGYGKGRHSKTELKAMSPERLLQEFENHIVMCVAD